MRDAKGQWRHTPGDPRPHVVSQGPDLQRLRHRETETEAGTHMDLPQLRTRHDRNLRAAINLRNLIMPAGRSRDGPGQEAMSTGVPASRWGHLGSVIVPH